MKRSESLNEFAAALAKAQGAFPAVERNREVEVTMKSGGKYEFSYSTLDAIVDAVREPLSQNGLAWMQGLDGSDHGSVIETLIMHSSGQWVETTTPVRFDGNGAQALGSGISYTKRYALCAALGIVSEDDDDANGADGNTIKKTDKPKSSRSADDPNWTGPLNKSALKDRIRAVWADIDNCQDAAVLPGLLEDNIEIINQCARDLPDWWMQKKGHQVNGLKIVIFKAGKDLDVKVQGVLDSAEQSRAPSASSVE